MRGLITSLLFLMVSSVALANDYTLMTSMPTNTTKERTSAEGFFVELLTEVFKRAELPMHVKKGPWIHIQRVVQKADASRKLVITPLTRTPHREKRFDWILPIINYELTFVTVDKSIDVNDVDAMKEMPVCAYRESPAEFKLRTLGFKKVHARVLKHKCYEGLLNRSEKIMLTHGKITAIKSYKLVQGNPADLIFGKSFEEQTLYLASSRGAVPEEDKAKLEKALMEIKKDGTFLKIYAKYEKT